MNRANRWRSKSGQRGSRDTTRGGDGRSPPDRRYPIVPARRVCHRPRHRQHSSQRQWGRRPAVHRVSFAEVVYFYLMGSVGEPHQRCRSWLLENRAKRDGKENRSCEGNRIDRIESVLGRRNCEQPTSGKVPLEKTLETGQHHDSSWKGIEAKSIRSRRFD